MKTYLLRPALGLLLAWSSLLFIGTANAQNEPSPFNPQGQRPPGEQENQN